MEKESKTRERFSRACVINVGNMVTENLISGERGKKRKKTRIE